MGWKNNGELAAPMWDHYRVQHACNNGKAIEKMQFRCVTTMSRRAEIKLRNKSKTVSTVQRLALWEVHLGTR